MGLTPPCHPRSIHSNPRIHKSKDSRRVSRTLSSSFYRERLACLMGEVCLTYLAAPPLYHIKSRLEGVCLNQASSPQALQPAISSLASCKPPFLGPKPSCNHMHPGISPWMTERHPGRNAATLTAAESTRSL